MSVFDQFHRVAKCEQCDKHAAESLLAREKKQEEICARRIQNDIDARLEWKRKCAIKREAYTAVYKRPTSELLQIIPEADEDDINGRFGKYTMLVICEAEPTEGGLYVIRMLLERGAFPGESQSSKWNDLSFFCRYDRVGYVRMLLEREDCPDINWSCEEKGLTATMIACMYGHTRCLELLLEHGVDLERHERFGDTALMCAIEKKHTDCVRMLLDYGACPNAQNSYAMFKCNDGNTALMMACRYHDTTCCELLLAHGADIRQENNHGKTVFDKSLSSKCLAVLEMHQNNAEAMAQCE